MTPIQELQKICKDRLETLAMYYSMLTALGICFIIASCVLALYSKFGGVDYNAYAILCIPACACVAWIRQNVRDAIRRQEERVKEISALAALEPSRGGGLLV